MPIQQRISRRYLITPHTRINKTCSKTSPTFGKCAVCCLASNRNAGLGLELAHLPFLLSVARPTTSWSIRRRVGYRAPISRSVERWKDNQVESAEAADSR